jgi:hypothetical protein
VHNFVRTAASNREWSHRLDIDPGAADDLVNDYDHDDPCPSAVLLAFSPTSETRHWWRRDG